jgi:hypothetical protein
VNASKKLLKLRVEKKKKEKGKENGKENGQRKYRSD